MQLLSGLVFCCVAVAAAQDQGTARTLTLRSPQLEVLLDRDAGLPYEYRLLSNQAVIRGAEPGHAVTATVFHAQPYSFQQVMVKPRSAKTTATGADFYFTAEQDRQPAASFTLRYELQGAAVFVSLEDVQEMPGFQLIDVGTPDLASVREEDGGGWLGARGNRRQPDPTVSSQARPFATQSLLVRRGGYFAGGDDRYIQSPLPSGSDGFYGCHRACG
jgi:hypothetical protein